MTADGSSSLVCKATALLLAGTLHVVVFWLTDFNIDTPLLAQPKTTRVLVFPVASVEVAEEVQNVEFSQPPVEPPPASEGVTQEEPSPVEIPKPEPPPEPISEPVPEPIPESTPEPIRETKPELPPVAEDRPVVAEPEHQAVLPEPVPAEAVAVESPVHPEPPAVKEDDDSDGSFDVAPVARRVIKPEYPLEARQEKWEGDVVCEVLISKRGKVLEASVVEGSGHDVLDAAALKAVRVARFEPAVRRGTAIEVRVRFTVDFRLDSHD